jgi:hypothetical protein
VVAETVHSVEQIYLPSHALSPTDVGSKVRGDSGGSFDIDLLAAFGCPVAAFTYGCMLKNYTT